jgi:hypothetical protein
MEKEEKSREKRKGEMCRCEMYIRMHACMWRMAMGDESMIGDELCTMMGWSEMDQIR